MLIRWTKQASQQLEAAHAYVLESSSLSAADRQVEAVLLSVEQLTTYPELGRPGRVDGTRELVIPRTPYIVAYRVSRGALSILAVLHGARRWPKRF